MFFFKNKKKVLIIDDDPSILRQVSFHLSNHRGYTTLLAENAENGLEQANTQSLDLIILDWMLPDLQGIELLAILKNKPKTRNIPVLMLTSRSKIGDAENAFQLGASGYMFKPFSLERLGEKSTKLIEHEAIS